MTIHKAGTMLTLTSELGTLRGALAHGWDDRGSASLRIEQNGEGQNFFAPAWTVTPDRTLPTTPGSVVRGDAGRYKAALFALTAENDSFPWYGISGDSGYFAPDKITNWTLLFDAATAEVSE
jgi:hypothetical protein